MSEKLIDNDGKSFEKGVNAIVKNRKSLNKLYSKFSKKDKDDFDKNFRRLKLKAIVSGKEQIFKELVNMEKELKHSKE